MLGILLNMGRQTISRAIETIGNSQRDWSAVYRLFERERVDVESIQKIIRLHVQKQNASNEPLIAFIDDTLLKKRGSKIYGTSWKLDPLGPKFTHNFIWAQRYMQISWRKRKITDVVEGFRFCFNIVRFHKSPARKHLAMYGRPIKRNKSKCVCLKKPQMPFKNCKRI